MFSKNLRFLREKNQMEQQELAEKLGRKSSSTISEWEKGKYTPRIGVLNDISEIFNVSISDLMNTDLSQEIQTKNDLLLQTFNKLEESRKNAVMNFAEVQLKQQTSSTANIVNFKKSDELIEDDGDAGGNSSVAEGSLNYEVDFAAHFVDPNRVYTPEEIDAFKAYLSKAKEDYLKNHD